MPQINAGAIDWENGLLNKIVVTSIYKLVLTTKPKVRANTFFILFVCIIKLTYKLDYSYSKACIIFSYLINFT